MSDIRVGDLVMVVRQARSHECSSLGAIFRVTKIRSSDYYHERLGIRRGESHFCRCAWCGWTAKRTISTSAGTWMLVEGGKAGALTHMSRLKRIPPLSDLEGVTDEERLTV